VADQTIDAFHRGSFSLVQPARGGHRAGMDALALAAAVPSNFAGRLADLGAGAGAAGLAVASRCQAASVVLVENSAVMAGYARQSLELPENTRLSGRVSVLEADVALIGKARTAAGLTDNSFDFAIMNPPFNAEIDRPTPDELRRQAHVMEDGLFEAWLRTAAAIVRPRGEVAIIARPASFAPILAALDGRFGTAQIVPVHARPDAPAIRILLRAVRGARGGPSLMPPLILHEGSGGAFSARAEAINAGEASLFGD
jgi:tRNA1(Val) A37 N6-methylase TrmN6